MSCGAVLSIVLLYSIDYVKVFVTSHRKGPCDSVGGTVKHLALCANLQCPSNKQILSPMTLFEFATKNIIGILFGRGNNKGKLDAGKVFIKGCDHCWYCQAPHLYTAHQIKGKAYHLKVLLSF